jgi:hypothetical protein
MTANKPLTRNFEQRVKASPLTTKSYPLTTRSLPNTINHLTNTNPPNLFQTIHTRATQPKLSTLPHPCHIQSSTPQTSTPCTPNSRHLSMNTRLTLRITNIIRMIPHPVHTNTNNTTTLNNNRTMPMLITRQLCHHPSTSQPTHLTIRQLTTHQTHNTTSTTNKPTSNTKPQYTTNHSRSNQTTQNPLTNNPTPNTNHYHHLTTNTNRQQDRQHNNLPDNTTEATTTPTPGTQQGAITTGTTPDSLTTTKQPATLPANNHHAPHREPIGSQNGAGRKRPPPLPPPTHT